MLPVSMTLAALITAPYLVRWLAPERLAEDYDPVSLQLPVGHEYVPSDLGERVLQRLRSQGELFLLDRSLAKRVATALAEEPWVRNVNRVEKHRDGTLVVDLEYRRPVLMVRSSQGVYAVDRDGVLLPTSAFTASDVERFPVAVNVHSLPGGIAGQAWGDPVVKGAAMLADRLLQESEKGSAWKRFGMREIRLPDRVEGKPDRLCYVITTSGQSEIVWGEPPETSEAEPTFEEKLQRLDYYLQRFGSFEEPHGTARIDIRHFHVISAEPIDHSWQ